MAVEKKNIFLKETIESMPYGPKQQRGNTKFPKRETWGHAQIIKRKLKECYENSLTQKQVAAIRYKSDIKREYILNFQVQQNMTWQ